MKVYQGNSGWQYWYDRPTRSWWAAIFDAEGNQTNEAVFAYTKEEILRDVSGEDLA
jgi:hypothetical protein